MGGLAAGAGGPERANPAVLRPGDDQREGGQGSAKRHDPDRADLGNSAPCYGARLGGGMIERLLRGRPGKGQCHVSEIQKGDVFRLVVKGRPGDWKLAMGRAVQFTHPVQRDRKAWKVPVRAWKGGD